MEKKCITENEFAQAFEDHSDAIFRHCYFRTNGRDKALELMQETFTKAWEYITKDNEIENLRAFLYRVANNLIIDDYRKKKTDSLDLLMESGFEPQENSHGHASTFLQSEASEAAAMLNQLEEEERKIIIMRYFDELSPKEISKITGQTENNISVKLHRSIKKLKEIYNKK